MLENKLSALFLLQIIYIAIFTDKEDMPLGKVMDLIYEKENGGPAIEPKSDTDKLKAWFEGILPEYSKEKVYTSDI